MSGFGCNQNCSCEEPESPDFFEIGGADGEGCDITTYIRGPQGVQGPQGIPGMQGPPGPSGLGGIGNVVTESTVIPVTQVFTVVNATGPTTQQLPLIADVIVGSMWTPYNIQNYSGFLITVLPSGSDLIQKSSEAFEKFDDESVTFLPTPLGWLVI
jgi:hypothetical protein